MRVRTDMPPEGKEFILFLIREPASAGPRYRPESYAWAGIAQAVVDQGELCFVMAGTGNSEADGIEIEMDRGLRWAWAEIDDMSQEAVPWEGRES